MATTPNIDVEAYFTTNVLIPADNYLRALFQM